MYVPTDVEVERRNRIRVAVAAYAYELMDDSLMSDYEYDMLSRRIRPEIDTGDVLHDTFFREHFMADSGMWVHQHPDQHALHMLYKTHFEHRAAPVAPTAQDWTRD